MRLFDLRGLQVRSTSEASSSLSGRRRSAAQPALLRDVLGFVCNGELDSEGCLHLKDADGFDVTLARRLDVSPPSTLHFGIRLADPDSVHRLLTRLSAENVETGELFTSHHRVGFHCFDPSAIESKSSGLHEARRRQMPFERSAVPARLSRQRDVSVLHSPLLKIALVFSLRGADVSAQVGTGRPSKGSSGACGRRRTGPGYAAARRLASVQAWERGPARLRSLC
jgi:hypothetical protein